MAFPVTRMVWWEEREVVVCIFKTGLSVFPDGLNVRNKRKGEPSKMPGPGA